MKVIFGIILTLCIVATIFVMQINEDNGDNTITQLYTGSVPEEAYSAKGRVKSCPGIMVAKVYQMPSDVGYPREMQNDNTQENLLAYDKYGTEIIKWPLSSLRETYSYKLDSNSNLEEISYHSHMPGIEFEIDKVTLTYHPETNIVEMASWGVQSTGSPRSTSSWKYELDEQGHVIDRVGIEGYGDRTYDYQYDPNGNLTHILTYNGDELHCDDWFTYDTKGNELMTGADDMSADEPFLAFLCMYENKIFDECGNWTCREVDMRAFGSSSETLFIRSYTEYRSLLYYPD